VIEVETRPVRMRALQWNGEGDGAEVGVVRYFLGKQPRFGLQTMTGMQRVQPGDWIVLGTSGDPQVYAPGEFHHKFKIIEEGQPS
jgi:hypothetical protein